MIEKYKFPNIFVIDILTAKETRGPAESIAANLLIVVNYAPLKGNPKKVSALSQQLAGKQANPPPPIALVKTLFAWPTCNQISRIDGVTLYSKTCIGQKIRGRIWHNIKLVNMTHFTDKIRAEISSGMKQPIGNTVALEDYC